MNWQHFLKITQFVRNNTSENFDGALAAVYTKDILDVVRIYAPGIIIDTLKKLKIKYNQELQKYN